MARVAKDLRNDNRVRVVKTLIESLHPISRAEISRKTGMSAPTVMRIVDELEQRNVVNTCDMPETGVGRKPVGLCLNSVNLVTAAVLHEGTHLQAGILDLRGKPIQVRHALAENDLENLLTRQSLAMIQEMLRDLEIPPTRLAGLGVALPAILNPNTNVIDAAPLIGIDSQKDISACIDAMSQALRAPVRLENDVNALAVGEHADRRLGQQADMAYIALGTGIGCGLMLRGKLRRGRRNMAGEIGYLCIARDGAQPGQPGELERRIGLRSLEECAGHALCPSMTDESRRALIDYIVRALAPCIVNLSVSIDLDLMVLGGHTLSLLGDDLVARLADAVRPLAPFTIRIERGISKTPGLTGLGVLMRDHYLKRLAQYGLEGED